MFILPWKVINSEIILRHPAASQAACLAPQLVIWSQPWKYINPATPLLVFTALKDTIFCRDIKLTPTTEVESPWLYPHPWPGCMSRCRTFYFLQVVSLPNVLWWFQSTKNTNKMYLINNRSYDWHRNLLFSWLDVWTEDITINRYIYMYWFYGNIFPSVQLETK